MTATPDGPRGEWPPRDGAPLPPGLLVPDDARDLEADRLALLRERAATRRQARLSRLVFTRRWHNHGISGPIVAICLFVVFIFAALLALVVPNGGNSRQPALPLAKSSVASGHIGSLLPDEQLTGVGAHRVDLPTRDLRPGVVLVIPAGCSASAPAHQVCADAVSGVTGSARDRGLFTWLIGAAGDSSLAALAETPSVGTYAIPFIDPGGSVPAAFPAGQTPTAVFIDGSGIVRSVVPGLTATLSVTSVLDRLSGLAN